mmetsp:Transcript_128595/g.333410  ORF Transcript_128595/g.333410 Transcript_128595/m.333410 type:complete len:108 (-) Transcript_128595:335-658(-)
MEALEAERTAFKTTQDLAEQNQNLRKAIAKLRAESETSAQNELQALRDERKQQEEEWAKHLEDKAMQMKSLADTVVQLTQEREEAHRLLKEHRASAQRDTAAAAAAA